MVQQSIIQIKSFSFALDIIKLYMQLQDEREWVLSKQLLRSGTAIGANVEEATGGQSKKDFLSKMSIASKEARETVYWLKLLKESDLTKLDVSEYLAKSQELVRILASIVKTMENKLRTKN
jgi:four helix bundle protein